jgi:hypothetical protein
MLAAVNRFVKRVLNVAEVILAGVAEKLRHFLVRCPLVAFQTHDIVASLIDNLLGDGSLASIASTVIVAPRISKSSRSFGIAAILLDLSSVASCPSVSRFSAIHALTTCSALRPVARSKE